eukprot:630930-Pelagomonas_calceolata.AAC.2
MSLCHRCFYRCYANAASRQENLAGTLPVTGGNAKEMDPQRLSYEQLEEFQEQERRKEAVDAVAEMLLAAEQIKRTRGGVASNAENWQSHTYTHTCTSPHGT